MAAVKNATNVTCFVPFCSNKKTIDGHQIHYFKVPDGHEGLRWKVAVNSNYAMHDKKIGILGRTIKPTLYCCERHFNIETDCIVNFDEIGLVTCHIKPGITPSTKPTKSKRLWEIEDEYNRAKYPETKYNDLLEPMNIQCDIKNVEISSCDFTSIVDMSTAICTNFKGSLLEHQIDPLNGQFNIKFEPMMPLTVDLMKRKSVYYMGLERNTFFRLLQIISCTVSDSRDTLMEMKVMLALRKNRLNEEFEALGDLFDIDANTVQQYITESTNLISSLCHTLANSTPSVSVRESYDVKNPSCAEEDEVDEEDDKVDEEVDEEDESSTDSELNHKYKGQDDEDSDFTDIESESDTSSFDYESDEKESSKDRVIEKVQCPLCEEWFGNIDYHMKMTHMNLQALNKTMCGLCFADFENNKLLRDHQTDIHNGNSCLCDVCGKYFSDLHNVKRHILVVHSKYRPFLCDLCGLGFISASRLKSHEENKHLRIRRYECNLCDKKYFMAKNLESHVRGVHTKERPFPCRFDCGKSFTIKCHRIFHEQTHKSKYKCEVCLKEFSYKHNLKTHSKNIHGRNVIDMEKCKIEISQ